MQLRVYYTDILGEYFKCHESGIYNNLVAQKVECFYSCLWDQTFFCCFKAFLYTTIKNFYRLFVPSF